MFVCKYVGSEAVKCPVEVAMVWTGLFDQSQQGGEEEPKRGDRSRPNYSGVRATECVSLYS